MTRLLLAAGKHELHRLPGILCRPDAVLSSLPPLIARCVLAAAACGLAHDDLEVALLAAEPVAYKVGRVLGQALEEAVFGLGVGDGLDDNRKLLVQNFNLVEHVCVLRIAQELLQSGVVRVVHGDADVVDCGLGVLVELLINTDGVGKLDWRKGLKVRSNVLLQGWDMACVPLDDLGVICQYPGAMVMVDEIFVTYLPQQFIATEISLLLILLEAHQLDVLPQAHDDLGARGSFHIHHIR